MDSRPGCGEPMSGGVLQLAVVCEAPADARTGCALAERAWVDAVDWLAGQDLDNFRRWRGELVSEAHLEWHQLSQRVREHGWRLHGHFGGEPGAPDALATRKALTLLLRSPSPPDAIVLLRDSDGEQENRLKGMSQAIEELPGDAPPVVIGLAHTKRECWVLAGFEAGDDDEHQRLNNTKQELGFDPTLDSERLTATGDHDKKSAKRVLGHLTLGDAQRECDCWENTSLSTLSERGRGNGLADYLETIREALSGLLL